MWIQTILFPSLAATPVESVTQICENRSATAWEYPTCIFNPTSTQDVVFAVKVLSYTGAKYAVRGGGHTPLTGWANIDNGVLISLSNLTDLKYDAASETVRAGTGNRWGDIYSFTEPIGRLVVGGRVTDVGMGLVLGGKMVFSTIPVANSLSDHRF
jgi:FAD/FMN-containing dehydrogenase